MIRVIRKKAWEPDVFAALCSFLAGSVFFVGLAWHLVFSSLKIGIETMGKITIQSNLIAFVVSGLYFFKPNSRIFKTNFWPLLAVTLLVFAALGFWCLLFPVYYIDLQSFIISTDEAAGTGPGAAWYAIWDHAVTPILFVIFFYYLNQKRTFHKLNPISPKKIRYILRIYFVSWVLWNVFASTVLEISPNYGVLTNFNPRVFYSDDLIATIFNLKVLVFAHIFCLLLVLGAGTFFSRFAMKFRAIHKYEMDGYSNIVH